MHKLLLISPTWYQQEYALSHLTSPHPMHRQTMTSGPLAFDTQHEDLIHDAQVDYYGRRLATASSDRTVRLWSVAPGQPEQFICSLSGYKGRGDAPSFYAADLDSPLDMRVPCGRWPGPIPNSAVFSLAVPTMDGSLFGRSNNNNNNSSTRLSQLQ